MHLLTGMMLIKDIRVLTHSHSERPKQAWQFWIYFSNKGIFWKIFEGEMLIRSQTTTLLQIFCELLLYSQVSFKSMKVADDTSKRNSECEWVKKDITSGCSQRALFKQETQIPLKTMEIQMERYIQTRVVFILHFINTLFRIFSNLSVY